jgi:hypothetical protein
MSIRTAVQSVPCRGRQDRFEDPPRLYEIVWDQYLVLFVLGDEDSSKVTSSA